MNLCFRKNDHKKQQKAATNSPEKKQLAPTCRTWTLVRFLANVAADVWLFVRPKGPPKGLSPVTVRWLPVHHGVETETAPAPVRRIQLARLHPTYPPVCSSPRPQPEPPATHRQGAARRRDHQPATGQKMDLKLLRDTVKAGRRWVFVICASTPE